MNRWNLGGNLEAIEVSVRDLWLGIQNHYDILFPPWRCAETENNVQLTPLSPAEKESPGRYWLAGETYQFMLFRESTLVGWHFGNQESPDTYYMRNSAILPAFQGKGHYTEFLRFFIMYLAEKGYANIRSLHRIHQNDILIAKLKQGFSLTGMQVSPRFGTLAELRRSLSPRVDHIGSREGSA